MPAHHRSGAGLAALAVTQVVAWGVLFYAVLVAAPAIAAETGWADEHIFLAITAGLLTSAGCAIPVGRWLDRHPRRVMVSGAIVGTGALLAAAASPSIWSFAAAWIVCGAAQAAVLYQAAFTVITHRYRSERRGPLTLVTLAGGLASTIFAPLTAWLVVEIGWRLAFVVLAAILAAVAIPAYAVTVERRWFHLDTSPSANGAARQALRSARFWMLTIALTLLSFSLHAATLSAVPASVEKGMDLQTAAWVLGLIGAGQVLGRLVYLVIPHTAAPWIAPALIGALGAAILTAYGIASAPFSIFATAIVAGAIRGALTLVQASAVADRWGPNSYGLLNGVIARSDQHTHGARSRTRGHRRGLGRVLLDDGMGHGRRLRARWTTRRPPVAGHRRPTLAVCIHADCPRPQRNDRCTCPTTTRGPHRPGSRTANAVIIL